MENFTQRIAPIIEPVDLEMVYIPGGTFTMGYPGIEDAPPHAVELSPFFIGKYQVTQAQWKAVMGNNPSHFKGDDLPVETVSWEDATEYCRRLSAITEREYRLLTEAQWEYAARAGSSGAYCFGDDPALLGEYAWFTDNAGNRTHPVGQKNPNAWGLYDVHGNVWEWSADWYNKDFYRKSPGKNPAGPESGKYRVVRGGAWFLDHLIARAVSRDFIHPADRYDDVGFRVCSVVRPPSESLNTVGAKRRKGANDDR